MKNVHRLFVLLCFLGANSPLIGESLCLGYITVTNPVIALLGTAISLVKIGHHFHINQNETIDPDLKKTTLVNLERNYYEKTKSELLELKNNLTQIKADLNKVKALIWSYFTHEFLQKETTLNVSQSPLYNTLS